ncbi:MAG: gamma carbonic anhydrase family protein [Terrimicrobiaceae bacterium]
MKTIHERLAEFLTRSPQTTAAAFIASTASIMGDVRLGENSSVFYSAVLRGDIAPVRVGNNTNIQDGAILHVADDLPAIIGDDCTVGHAAIVHACTIGDRCLIGMHATVLDGAEIGEESLIAAGAVVTPRTIIPPGSMVMGSPAKVKRPLSPEERAGLKHWAEKYVAVAQAHAKLKTS